MASLGRGRKSHYANISDSGEEEIELNPGTDDADYQHTYTTPSRSEGATADENLISHHQSLSPTNRTRSQGNDLDYAAVQRDFKKRYGGAKAPWTHTPRSTEDLQTHFQHLGDNAQNQLARKYNRKKQFFHLLGKIYLRWLVSLVLAMAMIGFFFRYEKIKVLDRGRRRRFNLISTGLYLTLGLNLAASLKGMALIVRWKLLARKKHKLGEIDLILGCHSLIKVFRLGVQSIQGRPRASMICFTWILINAIGRLSVALTGLTYSYDSANATAVHPGMVSVTDWSKLAESSGTLNDKELSLRSEHYAAHFFGAFSAILEQQNATRPGSTSPNSALYKPIEVAQEGFVYYFREFTDHVSNAGSSGGLAFKTPRYIGASAKCTYFPLIEGQGGNTDTVSYVNGTEKHTLRAISQYGPGATTWINPRSDLDRNKNWYCGSRCAAIAALQFREKDETGDGAFYDCEVTVSKVFGATQSSHKIADSVAATAAGAIGLEGYSMGPDQWEYVRYPPGSVWSYKDSTPEDNSERMAASAARFAIGVIAAKDIYGTSKIKVEGSVVWIGVLMKVKWVYLLLILCAILFVQLAMGIVAVAYANTVFCKDDSYLSTARLLRPVVERLGPSGCALAGEEISHTLRQYMVYGARVDETGERMHLDIGEDIAPRRRFPEGWYDGSRQNAKD